MTHINVSRSRPPEEILQGLLVQPAAARVASAGGRDGSFAPAFEVREYIDHFAIKADVPGVRSRELSLFVENDWVIVVGRRLTDESLVPMAYRAYERTFGAFWRAFRLSPGIVPAARASLQSGVLTVLLPKKTARVPGSCFAEVAHPSAAFQVGCLKTRRTLERAAE